VHLGVGGEEVEHTELEVGVVSDNLLLPFPRRTRPALVDGT
jgi:hypothetical protein